MRTLTRLGAVASAAALLTLSATAAFAQDAVTPGGPCTEEQAQARGTDGQVYLCMSVGFGELQWMVSQGDSSALDEGEPLEGDDTFRETDETDVDSRPIDDPSNTPPSVTDVDVTTEAGQSITVDVLRGASDPDGDELTVSDVTQPLNGSAEILDDQIVYTPGEAYVGEDAFTFEVSDGRGGVAQGTVRVVVSPATDDTPVPDTLAETGVTHPWNLLALIAGAGLAAVAFVRRTKA